MNIRALVNVEPAILFFNSGINIIKFFFFYAKFNFISYLFLFLLFKFANLSFDVTFNFIFWIVTVFFKIVYIISCYLIQVAILAYQKYSYRFLNYITNLIFLLYDFFHKILAMAVTNIYVFFLNFLKFFKSILFFFKFLILRKRYYQNETINQISDSNFDEMLDNMNNEETRQNLTIRGKKRTYKLMEVLSNKQQFDERMQLPIDGFIYLLRFKI